MIIGFNWILEGNLAGSGKPGLYAEPIDDLNFLKSEGFSTIVNLTESTLDDLFMDGQFEVLHYPIIDMSIPQPIKALELCEIILQRLEQSKKVLVHCKAGLGRTGTILACVLVMKGETAAEAITSVRKRIPMAIQNALQENFIAHFEQFYKKKLKEG